MKTEQQLKVVDTFANEIDANIVKGMLEANGIIAGVLGDSTAGALLNGFPIGEWKLVVLESDLEKALELINQQPDADATDEVYPESNDNEDGE